MQYLATQTIESNKTSKKTAIVLQKQSWGITATQTSRKLDITETILHYAGATLLCIAAALTLAVVWAQVNTENFHQTESIRLLSLAIATFAASGLALQYFSSIGVRKQLQVDTRRGVIRIGYLQTRRRFRESFCIAHSDILSAFLIRTNCSTSSRLALRLPNSPNPLILLNGTELDLASLLEEIKGMTTAEPNPKEGRRRTSRFLHMQFK